MLLLQHSPTITLGSRGDEQNLLVEEDTLHREGIELYKTDRGGDVTYHGPGQLVGYPVVHLRTYGISVGEYVRSLEKVLILTLQEFGIRATKIPHGIGLWVNGEKIAFLGVRVRGGITTHGFSLNVNNDLAPFQFIHPCGIHDMKVTSLAKILRETVDDTVIEASVVSNFIKVFGMEIAEKFQSLCAS